jgi:hypothetical protein
MATVQQRNDEAVLRIERWMGNYATNLDSLTKARDKAKEDGYRHIVLDLQPKIDSLKARIYDLDDLRRVLVGEDDAYIDSKAARDA